MSYHVELPLLLPPDKFELFGVLLVLVDVDPELPVVVVAVATAPFVAQKLVYHVLIACKSDAAEQLAVPQTELTPAVPSCVKGLSRESEQKQLSSTVVLAGGEHLPCTSKSGPQRAAQVGSVEKGTIAPFAVCACVNRIAERTERIAADEGRIMMAIRCYAD